MLGRWTVSFKGKFTFKRPPAVFPVCQKRRRVAPPNFVYLITVLFYTMLRILKFVLGQVRSGHQVRPSDLTSQKVCRHVTSTVFKRTRWNFHDYIRAPELRFKFLSRNFHIGDFGSCHYCRFAIISQWEKIERRLFWTKTILNTLEHQATGKLDTRFDTFH